MDIAADNRHFFFHKRLNAFTRVSAFSISLRRPGLKAKQLDVEWERRRRNNREKKKKKT